MSRPAPCRRVTWDRHGPRAAHRAGVRIVHRELSLCPNLTAAENFFLERAEPRWSLHWLGVYRRTVRDGAAVEFPGVSVDPDRRVGHLDIAARQMLEIAQAASDPGLRLLILDEPTSSS